MGIQYFTGYKQSNKTIEQNVTALKQTNNMDVMAILLNKYLDDNLSSIEMLKRIKGDYENALSKGFTHVVPFSSGGSIYIIISEEAKAEKIAFLSPTLTPWNPIQNFKDRKKEGKEHSSGIVGKFTTKDVITIFSYAREAKDKVDNLIGVPTLIIQGKEDEKIRPSGAIRLNKRLIHLDNTTPHELVLLDEGKHHLLSNNKTSEDTLRLIKDFFNKN